MDSYQFDQSSSSSVISALAMQQIVDSLRYQRHRDSTKVNYYSVWHSFNKFFVRLDQKPNLWEDRLTLFVGYLVQKSLKSNTIRSYISAIKAVLKQDRVNLCEDKYLLTSLTKACKYVNDHVRTRLPIQKNLCGYIIRKTEDYFQERNQNYLAIMYTSMFAVAYYRLLRVGELTTGSHAVKVTDIHIADNKNKILFILHTSKTHWTDSELQMIKLTMMPHLDPYEYGRKHNSNDRKEMHFCPYNLIRRFMNVRRKYKSPHEPFYIFQDHSVVTPRHMCTTLRTILTQIDLDPQVYRTHSFRIGCSIDMYNAHIDVGIIKKLGCWCSNIVYSYLK